MSKNVYLPILSVIFISLLCACGEPYSTQFNSHTGKETSADTNKKDTHSTGTDELSFIINDTPVTVEWELNESVNALKKLVKDEPLTIQMSMYGGFEQVGPFGSGLPANDEQITTSAGDIVLYSGNQLVVFYGSNSWSYTRLGRITGLSKQELTKLLGSEDVVITISTAQ